VGEAVRTNECLLAEAVGLKQRIEMLEQETQQLSEASGVVKRDIEVSECYPKVKNDFTNLEHELGKLKEEMRAMMPKAGAFGSPTADVAVPPTPSISHAKKPRCPVPTRFRRHRYHHQRQMELIRSGNRHR
jgi:hypothetical protein